MKLLLVIRFIYFCITVLIFSFGVLNMGDINLLILSNVAFGTLNLIMGILVFYLDQSQSKSALSAPMLHLACAAFSYGVAMLTSFRPQ